MEPALLWCPNVPVSGFQRGYMLYPYLKYSKNSYIVKLPHGLNNNEIVNLSSQLGKLTDSRFHAWSANEESHYASPRFCVHLEVLNFPLDFWHPKFIKEVMASFGEVLYIDDEHILDNDRTCLKLWITCHGPRRIPPTVDILYNNKYKVCFIHMLWWEYNGIIHGAKIDRSTVQKYPPRTNTPVPPSCP